ncbi:uncharacterized protein LOC135208050 [Macrobrachium nipponense]|uniref:uncharacterized protein LOC135208050 n=1 Tax=Macrobrachium nipponense TaxID=159736 RepID=UPI0030C7F72F
MPASPSFEYFVVPLVLQLVFTPMLHAGRSIPALTLSDAIGDGLSSSACYPDDLPEGFGANFTVCTFIKPLEISVPQTNQMSNLSLDYEDYPESDDNKGFDGLIFTIKYLETFMEASFLDSKLVVTYGNKSYTFGTPFEANVWRRICVFYSPDDLKVHSVVGDYYAGQVNTEDARNDTSEYDRFCLGSPDESLSTFPGTLAALSVTQWNESHDDTEYFPPTDCSNLINEDAFSILDTSWNLQGAALMSDYDVAELCNEAHDPITIKISAGHKPHLDLCKSINGRFLTEGELNDDLIEGIANITESCGASDDEKSFWYSGKTSGVGLQMHCPAASANGTNGTHPCISKLQCSVCLIPTKTSFTLYGEVLDQDRNYSFRTLGNGKFYLKGKDASEIYHNGSVWMLKSHLHDNDWYLSDSIFPCGRNVWKSGLENLTLTVTQCNWGQFACNNGNCIMKALRCDGNEDCEGGEDEKDCSIIRLNRGYDKNKSPGSGRPKQEFLYYTVFFYSIGDIATSNGKVTVDFLIYLTWYEPRLKFWNLRPQLQYFPCDMIWHPDIKALAGYKDGQAFDLDIYDKKCGSESYHPPAHRAFDDHWMGEYLDGLENSLFLDIFTRLTIPCNFKLHRYPFGSYLCNISMYILSGRESMAFKSFNDEGVNTLSYKGSPDLLEFRLEKITYETLHDLYGSVDYTNLLVTFHLRSLYDYHVLNSFGPSSLIFLISVSTFFFPIDDFNERIMVSLTALLVLAALFTQASSSSVKTPYYKLLDVWYAALIALCFVAVIMITCINSIKTKKSPDVTIKVRPVGRLWCSATATYPGSPRNKAVICNFVSKIVLISLFIMLVIVYVLFASGKM